MSEGTTDDRTESQDTAARGVTDIAEVAAETDPVIEHVAEGETYTIRRFREHDKRGFLELHDATETLELGSGEDWFDWKFVDPPALAHTPVFVAAHEGEIVGARPFVSFRLRAGPRTAVGLQTGDTMVHPDHRSRGLFSRMNELAFAYYRRREPEVMFSIPNARSRPAYLDIGARVVSPVPNHLRLENPSTFVGDKLGRWAPDSTGAVLDGLADGYHRLRDRRRNGLADDDVTVTRHATVPVDTLTALAAGTVPDEIHVQRDRAFYEWRFANPGWTYETYVASRNGDPVAAMVAGTRGIDGRVRTRLADVVPLVGEDRLPGVAAVLERILQTKPETDVFTFSGWALPDEFLGRFGFQPDDELPLSPVANSTVLITMPLGASDGSDGGTGGKSEDDASDWTIENRDVTDPENWLFPYCEHNTG